MRRSSIGFATALAVIGGAGLIAAAGGP